MSQLRVEGNYAQPRRRIRRLCVPIRLRTFSYAVPVGSITDPDAADLVSYSVKLADGSALPAWLSFDAATRTLSGMPDAAAMGDLNLALWGEDSYGAKVGLPVSLHVGDVDRAPVLAMPLADQGAMLGAAFSFTVPAGAFTDPDAGDTFTYSATLADGGAMTMTGSFPLNGGWAGEPGIDTLHAASIQGGHVFTEFHCTDRFAPACRRTRRASVPARLRARGLGACTTRSALHQHLGLHANSAASANWLRRSGTATRHVCGVGGLGDEQCQARNVHFMQLAGQKWLETRMNAALSNFSFSDFSV